MLHQVGAGNRIFRRLELRPAQIAELEFVHRGGPDDAGIGDGSGHLALVIERAVARQGIGCEGVGIGNAVASHQRIFDGELVIAPHAKQIVVGGAGAAIEIVLRRIAIGSAPAGNIRLGDHAGESEHASRHRIEAANGDDVPREDVAHKNIARRSGS